ncbi:MAG: glycosyltransferase family 4 protein [Opitutales bacterium]|nr:glycosyltransferase family 4 protein [Opitutales bacterium]
MSNVHSDSGILRVRIAPDWRGINPYQQLLAENVELVGGRVSFASEYRRGFPLWRDYRACSPRPDVLHLHWLSNYIRFEDRTRKWLYGQKLVFDLGLLRREGVGLVWTIHNAVAHEARHPFLERSLQKRVARRVDRVVLHSDSARDEVAGFYALDPDSIRVIPHGHYRSLYAPAANREYARRELNLTSARRVFLFFGLLRPYKGLEALLEAWKTFSVQPGAVGCHLIIAGKAPDPQYADQLRRCAEGVERVQLRVGFVPDEKIPTYFGAADIAVLPFQRILTSGSLLLAMGYGTPVVAPRIALVDELLGPDNPLTYDPSLRGGLLAALKAAADSSDLARLRARTLEKLENFSWDHIARKTLATYREAAACAALRHS